MHNPPPGDPDRKADAVVGPKPFGVFLVAVVLSIGAAIVGFR